MRRRKGAACEPDKVFAISLPSNATSPAVGAYKPTSRRATVLLPQPDSPTSASVLPRSIEKLTPSTACTNCFGLRSTTRFNHGADTLKVLARLLTSTSGTTCAFIGGPSCAALRYSP